MKIITKIWELNLGAWGVIVAILGWVLLFVSRIHHSINFLDFVGFLVMMSGALLILLGATKGELPNIF